MDLLNIDNIQAIPEHYNFEGGVKDFGRFSEGFCFKVITEVPKSSVLTEIKTETKRVKWVICLDSDKDKEEMMNILINLKLDKQHSQGQFLVYQNKTKLEEEAKGHKDKDNSKVKDHGSETTQSVSEMTQPKIEVQPGTPVDGYWVLLQDWSQCTLHCGGGLQYKQMMCVPPKKGGLPCSGPAVLTRPCNTKPCPRAIIRTAEGKMAEPEKVDLGNIKIRMMPISTRKLRYDRCYLKEDDALMVKDDTSTEGLQVLPKVPVRIVLNDLTVSIFQDDVYIS